MTMRRKPFLAATAFLAFLVIASLPIDNLLFSLVVSAENYSSTDDWPMFHHDPARTGYSPSPGPALPVKQIWNYTGSFRSSPAVVGNLIYYGTGIYLYCVNATTGSKVWNQTCGSYIIQRYGATMYDIINETKYYATYSSPAVAGGYVYMGSGGDTKGVFCCFNASTGEKVWSKEIGGADYSSPVVANGYVYTSAIGKHGEHVVYCFEAARGESLWNFTINVNSLGNWIYPAVAYGNVYFGSLDHNMYCLNALTGTKIWNYTTDVAMMTAPAAAYGFIYAASGDRLYCLNATTGEKVWVQIMPDMGFTSPAVANNRIYMGGGDHVFCFDALTGNMKWNYTAAWVIGSSVATDGTRVYAGCWDGNIYCIDASTGCKLWSYQTGDGPQSASPAIANGRIYVSGHGSSYWFTNETIPTTLYAIGEGCFMHSRIPGIYHHASHRFDDCGGSAGCCLGGVFLQTASICTATRGSLKEETRQHTQNLKGITIVTFSAFLRLFLPF
jgi:outer membrane protein assembly factor BamB